MAPALHPGTRESGMQREPRHLRVAKSTELQFVLLQAEGSSSAKTSLCGEVETAVKRKKKKLLALGGLILLYTSLKHRDFNLHLFIFDFLRQDFSVCLVDQACLELKGTHLPRPP
ncbi:hypothetical protein I79_007718 [Cricetulus griseus]|uniref:Uncharacterized protein n=1 Tax=Cricetulus griseus TaxID=10029 RepID=G3HB94_CRIGR|nr:hypothetical protein I79_007718 [Cricetulus griseus]